MSYSVSIKQIILTCLALYILTDVFSGLLLFLLNNIGIGYIFYSRDILILFPILFYIFKSFKETRISKLEIFIIIFLILIVTWGYINTFNLFLILYGIKIFCSFWLGIILIHYFNPKEIITDSKKIFQSIFFLTLIGLIINTYIIFPWDSIVIEVGDMEVEGARSWTTFGTETKRLGGFTRGSNLAATYLAITSLFLIVSSKNIFIKYLIFSLSIIGIFLTTMKGVLLSYLISFILYIYPLFRRKINKFALYIFLISIFLPICSSYLLPYIFEGNSTLQILLYSFFDRMVRVWPESINFILEKGNVILGRGIGGIGLAQIYFEADNYLPADNLFIYFWGNYGVLGLIIFILFLYKLYNIKNQNVPYQISLLTILFISNGIVAAVSSNAIYNIIIGYSFGYILLLNDGSNSVYSDKKQASIT
jgi:hypothetical protein